MKRPRVRKWAKWVCTLAAVLAVGAAVFGRFYLFRYTARTDSGYTDWNVAVGEGQIGADRYTVFLPLSTASESRWVLTRTQNWHWGYSGEIPYYGSAGGWNAGILYGRDVSELHVGMSVLYPVVLFTIPAALLWYAGCRRLKPGACKKCGYDRKGLAPSAVCPECGAPSPVRGA